MARLAAWQAGGYWHVRINCGSLAHEAIGTVIMMDDGINTHLVEAFLSNQKRKQAGRSQAES